MVLGLNERVRSLQPPLRDQEGAKNTEDDQSQLKVRPTSLH